MPSFESVVQTATLDIVFPDASLDFPAAGQDSASWLSSLSSHFDRKMALFDEHLVFLLVIRVPPPEAGPVSVEPPLDLLALLAHTQVSYDASYISPLSHAPAPAIRVGNPPASRKVRDHVPPSIMPPSTPNPIPAATEHDRRYVRAEGTPLSAAIWGEGAEEDSFLLVWDEARGLWTAVFRFVVDLTYLRMPYRDPLLAITGSITVRDKPMPSTPSRAKLDAMIAAAGGLPDSLTTDTHDINDSDRRNEDYRRYSGLEEINLLDGLESGAAISEDGKQVYLVMPSTRLGPKTRQTEFALGQPMRPRSPSSGKTPTSSRTHPTLRKSFRKTIPAVSGFRVRMRTVFVPHILLGASSSALTDDELAAGHAERTIVLCVEVENAGESGMGFELQEVDIAVGGSPGETRVKLIGWGGRDTVFPLRMGSVEQYNLLYAVELLVLPFTESAPGISYPEQAAELQRAVVINVQGRPFFERMGSLNFPTAAFGSRWNTTLDLSPKRNRDSLVPDSQAAGAREVLPEPPSPFPTPRNATSSFQTQPAAPPPPIQGLVAGTNKRYTAPAGSSTLSPPATRPSFRASTGLLAPSRENSYIGQRPSPLSKLAYTPPSVAVAAYARTPTTATTFAPPTPGLGGIPPPVSLSGILPAGEADEQFLLASPPLPPMTPAYPAYSPGLFPPTTPQGVGALGTGSTVGPRIDVQRGHTGPPGSATSAMGEVHAEDVKQLEEDAVVVSVGLLADGNERRKIHPHEQFTLDIFVFNRSKSTRRLEVSCPDRRRRRRDREKGSDALGILSLENHVRVGPLRPSTCQSVRMEFLALTAGVHSVDTLTLTDVETGFSMNLRSVLDVVVHERAFVESD